jgi:predicted amidohydrolase YtcJ
MNERAEQTPPGDWVIGQGSFMLAEKLAERRYPTLAEFDAAVPAHPALIRAGAHIQVVNRLGLQRLGINRDYTPPIGGHVQRDAAGEPTGVLVELGWALQGALPRFTLEQTEEALAALADQMSAYGVTSIQDQFPSANGLRAYQRLRRGGRFPLRISFTVHCPTLEAVKSFLRLGFESGFGDEWLKFGAVKFFVDGGITGAAGAFYDDYAHQPGNKGHLKLEQEELNEMVRLVDAAGCQISVHVVGDRALDLMLTALAAIPRRSTTRHRLEHFGHLCVTEERIERAKNLGLIPVLTMPFLSSFGDFLPEYLSERARGSFALRRLLDAGLPAAGSSDSLGAQPESLNPWFGMWCAVVRQTYLGHRLAPEEAVSPLEALRTYTTNAAYADFEEGRKGSIEPGKLADLIVCDRDPTTVASADLPEVRPVATILAGRVVAGSLAPTAPKE